MTHCFGRPEGLETLVRFTEKLWKEFVFEGLLGLNFSLQQNTRLGATKQRHSEKAGTIVKASSKFYDHGWFHLSAMVVLEQFSVWNGMTPNPYEKCRLLTLVTDVPLRSEYDQVRRTYSRKTCAWAKLNYIIYR